MVSQFLADILIFLVAFLAGVVVALLLERSRQQPTTKPAEPIFHWPKFLSKAEPEISRAQASLPRAKESWRTRRRGIEAAHNSKQQERDRFFPKSQGDKSHAETR